MSDLVNNPAHYTNGSIECLDYLMSAHRHDALAWQVVKYLHSYRLKGNPKQDLQKAEFYLKRMIDEQP